MTAPAPATASKTNASTSNASGVDALVVDGSCVDTGCGCASTPTSQDPQRRQNVSRAGLIGLLCILGCAAGPLAIGGLAAITGAVAGELWIIVAGFVVATVVYYYRRRAGRSGC